jgi:hypothetical protein
MIKLAGLADNSMFGEVSVGQKRLQIFVGNKKERNHLEEQSMGGSITS